MRKLAAILIILNVSIVLVSTRAISDQFANLNQTDLFLTDLRFKGILRFLPKTDENAKKAIFLIITSSWQYFLNPLHLDSALKSHGIEAAAYNYSFAGLIGPSML